jgi:chromosome segregation ATPase
MTPEDLDQIRAVMRDEIAAAEQRLTTRLERTMEALTHNLSEVREEFQGELKAGLAQVAIRLETLERRTDAVLVTLMSVDTRMSALTRQNDRLERDNGAMLANDAAQQRAFDQLALRVTKLERELHPEQQ